MAWSMIATQRTMKMLTVTNGIATMAVLRMHMKMGLSFVGAVVKVGFFHQGFQFCYNSLEGFLHGFGVLGRGES